MVFYVRDKIPLYYLKNLVFIVLIFAVFRMRICTSVTDHEVARAKNLLKTNILMQLDGMFCCFFFLNEEETK